MLSSTFKHFGSISLFVSDFLFLPYCQEKESQSSSSSPDIASLGKMEASPPLKYEKLLFLHSSSVCRSLLSSAKFTMLLLNSIQIM